MRFRLLLCSFFLVGIVSTSQIIAQSTYTITGSVVDESNNEIIPGTQIFLTGTTIGTTTNSEGLFELKNIPEGIFELSASFLGYEIESFNINTNSLNPEYNFVLTPIIYELDEVTVRPDPKIWKQNFAEFEKNFIGTGPFSKSTKIKNPEVLSFEFDPYERILSTSASDRLIIENKALGYRITYFLDYFVINYREGSSFYYGRPLFELMESSRRRINSRWTKNRIKAYNGSFLHFTKALIEGTAEKETFMSRGEMRDTDARYVSDSTISDNIYFFPVDSTTYMFSFINFINITYEAEKEDESYLEFIWNPLSRNPRTVVVPQNSSFTLTQDSVLVDKSGYIFDPLSIVFDGYWSFERVSDMMPINFTPSEK